MDETWEYKNSGYIGNLMSKNALHAYKMGQFTMASITEERLEKCGFCYPLEFFKWLCKKGYVKPVGFHHVGTECKMERFYSEKTISYVAAKYNLPLLYELYSGRMNRKDVRAALGIRYARIKVPSYFLGMKSSVVLTLDVIKYRDMFYISKNLRIRPEEQQVQILEEWEERPSDKQSWDNVNAAAIERRIITFKRNE